MGHLVFFIIQLFFLVLYILCKCLAWPGVSAISLLSWIIPIMFYVVLIIISLVKKQFKHSIAYLVFILLIACIPNKIWFVYHNIIFQFLLIITLFVFLLYKWRIFHRYFKTFAILILAINVFLLVASDNFVNENLGAHFLFKPYSGSRLSWDDFKKTDSIKGGYGAEIESFIFCRINKVYNFTSAIAVAKVDKDSTFYVVQTDDLLDHELCHFKITELVTRRLNRALDEHHFGSYSETRKVYWQYLDTLWAMQHAYDTETDHNLNTEKQKEWKQRIDRELKE